MNICILDADTLGNDISLDSIKEFGKIKSYGTTSPQETENRISECEIIITNKVVLGKQEIEAAKNLKLICVAATGYNNIDMQAACKAGITVSNVKGYSTEAVVQTVFSYMLLFAGNTPQFAKYTADGEWQKSDIFTHLGFPIMELKHKTLGIIGYGTIGKRTGEIAAAFGMKLLVAESLRPEADNTDRVSLENLLKESDFISIHAPLTETTKNLISLKEMKQMKPTAFLINTARGGIVNENDLRKALDERIIAGAGVDVLSQEPPRDGNPLIGGPNLILTPHIAWTSKESRKRLIAGIAENIRLFTEGKGKEINLCEN